MPVAPPRRAATRAQKGDRWLIFAQAVIGSWLGGLRSVLAALSKAATHDIGTAVIGVGAALIPAGAAASASARINQTLQKDGTEGREG